MTHNNIKLLFILGYICTHSNILRMRILLRIGSCIKKHIVFIVVALAIASVKEKGIIQGSNHSDSHS